MFKGVLNTSMLWKAQEQKRAEFSYIHLRDYGLGPRKTVDDTPYGGGDGMLLMVEPLHKAILAAKNNAPNARVILLTPRGETFNQAIAKKYADADQDLIFVCGRYEGYDERVTEWVDDFISIGEYVLTGGEVAAMVVIDAIVRLLPGVLGGETSAEIESFSDGKKLEYPHYTRPEVYKDRQVPRVLLSGNHAEITKWREEHRGAH
jgi:tRNA (guanine37-N1)-methyltransferase